MWLGGPFQCRTFRTVNRLFSVRFSDHHSNTWPFDNRTQILHLNTRLARYSDGYCIKIPSILHLIYFQKICPITRLAAKYFDPVTRHPYANLQAFKILREAYYSQLELKGDKNDPEVNCKAKIQWGLEYRTSLVFGWSIVVRFSPNHSKSEHSKWPL